jgi:hypothetical protein
MKFSTLSLIGLIGLLATFGCKNADDTRAPRPAPAVAPPPPPPVVQAKEKQVYVYSGDRFRDPFVPAGQSSAYQADAIFDPQRAVVKGIVFGGQQKGAVLIVGGSGTYFVKDGRIIDVMGKYVEGFSAKVSVDRVILQSSDDSTYELKLKGSEEEEKPS